MDTPRCGTMQELPSAAAERAKVRDLLSRSSLDTSEHSEFTKTPLFIHLSHGLAYTVGSALGSTPPTSEICLSTFLMPNKAGLTAGARAWSKHSHRSQTLDVTDEDIGRREASTGWWGSPSGPVAAINQKAVALFWKVMNGATWKNLHWLPHQVLVFEIRVLEGYGMRWSQDRSSLEGDEGGENLSWTFRGFVEPMMENGHELGWRH